MVFIDEIGHLKNPPRKMIFKSVRLQILASLIVWASAINAQITYPYQFAYDGNPLVRMHGAADPDVVVWGDTVWMYCSQDRTMIPGVHVHHYDAMDGYHAFSSTDMINWTDHGEILHSRDVSWGKQGWMWAPGAARKDGKYYLYFPHQDLTNNWRIGIAIADSPAGPFIDMGKPMEGIGGIDPKIFIDDDGEAYIYNNNSIVARLKPNMIELAESVRKINYAPQHVLDDELLRFNEGSYMHKKDGVYYYSYSNFNNQIHQGFYAMGDSPYGPFEWKGPMAPNPQGAQDHHSIIEFQGQWYYFYHITTSNYPIYKEEQGRISCYDRLYYNQDGTIQMVVHTLGPKNILKVDSPNGYFTLSPAGGAYNPGSNVTISLNSKLGFAFDFWSGDLSGTANPATLVMNSDKTITANFIPTPTYTLSASATNGNVRFDPPGGVYNEGTIVKLTPIDNFGYDFSSWSGDLTGSQNPATITMNSNKSVTANFLPIPIYPITVNASNGSIILNPPGGNYEQGSIVTIEAVRDYGYVFSGWSGDFTGTDNPATVTMNAEKNITANFTYQGGGTVVFATNSGGAAYKSKEGVKYSSDENFSGGSKFTTKNEISGTEDDFLFYDYRFGSNFSYTIPLPNASYEVTLMFAETFWTSTGKRVFDVSVEGIKVLSNLDVYSKVGKNAAYVFTYQTAINDGKLNIAFGTSVDNAIISAIKVIRKDNFSLTADAVNGLVELNPPGGTYSDGTKVTITARPDTGYTFSYWTGDISGSTNPTIITMNSNKSVTANLSLIPKFSLSINSTNGSIHIDPPGGTYYDGTIVTITAKPDTGYIFSNWEGDLSGFANPASIVMNNDKNVIASFSTSLSSGSIRNNFAEKSRMEQNYPNPFTTETTIPYELDKSSQVKLSVYSIYGQKVATLVNKFQTAGRYNVVWNPNSSDGIEPGNRLYLLVFETGADEVSFKKSIIMQTH